MRFTQSGKLSMIIDGQFGSTGKGLIAGYVALNDRVDFGMTNASANAGHTCIMDKKYVAYHLPMVSVLTNRPAFLCAGSIIDPRVLLAEIETLGVAPENVHIHPRAAVIEPEDVAAELQPDSSVTKIGSTQHGVGRALARKINRSARLAEDVDALKPFIVADFRSRVRSMLMGGAHGVMEVPQGFGLGINSGYAYPYCTSREISVSQALSDAQLHPSLLGAVMMTLRTYPIRVGSINNAKRGEPGWSGPFYWDSSEVTWAGVGVEPERTTVTGRIRRIGSWSQAQLQDAVLQLRPDVVFLNFVNYLKYPGAFDYLRSQLVSVCGSSVPHLYGLGPDPRHDVVESVEEVYTRKEWNIALFRS